MKPEIMSQQDLELGANVAVWLLCAAVFYFLLNYPELKRSKRIKKQYPSALDEHEEKLSA